MPESPIRHSGAPAETHPPVVRALTVGGVDVGVGREVEVLDPLGAGEPGFADPAGAAAGIAVVALGEQQLGEEPGVRVLLTFRGGDVLGELLADGGQPQHPAGCVDRGGRSLVGDRAAALLGRCPSRRRGRRSGDGGGHETASPWMLGDAELAGSESGLELCGWTGPGRRRSRSS